MKQRGILLVMIACIFWGFMGITSRNLYAISLDSWTISFFRASIAGIFYLLWILKKDKSLLKIDFKSIIFFAIYGIVTFGFCFISYNISVSRIPISIATVLMFTNPIWVMLMHRIFFKEKISEKKVLVMIVTILGCMLIAKIYQIQNYTLDGMGIIAGLLTGFFFALQIVMPRFYHGECKKDTMLIYGFIFAGLFLAMFTDFKKTSDIIFSYGNLVFVIGNIIVIGVFNTFIANTAYIKSVEYIDASLASILASLEPVISSIFAYCIFKETLEPLQLLDMLIVIGAVSLLEVDMNMIFKKRNLRKRMSH